MVKKCSSCGEPYRTAGSVSAQPVSVADASVQTVSRAKKNAATVSNDGAKPINVVKEARIRLRYTAREIKRLKRELKAFETEHTQLQRLLNAADGKPTLAAVSKLKTNTRG